MFRILQQGPIAIPGLIPGFASEGYMALYPFADAPDANVVMRTVGENCLAFGQVVGSASESEEFGLYDVRLWVSRFSWPWTHDRKQVVGYEDPTVLDGRYGICSTNPVVACTQVYPKGDRPGVCTNLVGFPFPYLSDWPITLVTPEMAMAAGLAPYVDMVKEPAVIPWPGGRNFLVFEYGDGKYSNMGIGEISNGRIIGLRRFRTALDDESEHISTIDSPVITAGTFALPFNRRRKSEPMPATDTPVDEWAVTYMTLREDNDGYPMPDYVYPEWLVRPTRECGLGPGKQLILFGSALMETEEGMRLYAHLNDCTPWYVDLTWL